MKGKTTVGCVEWCMITSNIRILMRQDFHATHFSFLLSSFKPHYPTTIKNTFKHIQTYTNSFYPPSHIHIHTLSIHIEKSARSFDPVRKAGWRGKATLDTVNFRPTSNSSTSWHAQGTRQTLSGRSTKTCSHFSHLPSSFRVAVVDCSCDSICPTQWLRNLSTLHHDYIFTRYI